jgi:hypothetical protein
VLCMLITIHVTVCHGIPYADRNGSYQGDQRNSGNEHSISPVRSWEDGNTNPAVRNVPCVFQVSYLA